jgi:hypothetical protein
MDPDRQLIETLRQRVLAAGQDSEVPATPQQIARAEARVGFETPSLLRLVWLHVGNGGFGADGELMGVRMGWTVGQKSEIAEEAYLARRSAGPDETGWAWPEGWLPICNNGCGVYYCVCCRDDGFPVVAVDPNGYGDNGVGPTLRRLGLLREWLVSWAALERWPSYGPH